MQTEQPTTILLVDDIPTNIAILFQFLRDQGFKVLTAEDGKEAIERAMYALPDLILLDVMMPEMDGFDVCETLKEEESTKDIPIIFMTALTDTVDKVKGLSLGAVDYITKPIQQEEVLARVNTHISLRKFQMRAKEQIVALEKRNVELNTFARTVAHDLKNPLNGVIGLTEMVLEDCEEGKPLDEDSVESLKLVLESGKKMVEIIDALLLLAGSTKHVQDSIDVELKPINMSDVIRQVTEKRLAHMIEQFHGSIIFPDNLPTVKGYAPWVEEIWANYLSNGLKYGGFPPKLEIGASVNPDKTVRFWVKDNGKGLSEEQQKKIFTPFTRLHKELAEGHGLGLSIVRQVAEKLGGEVGMESAVGQGSTFSFTLQKVDE